MNIPETLRAHTLKTYADTVPCFATVLKKVEKPTPLLVAVPAPVGYGKTQLILAWLAYLRSTPDQPQWAALAITGVAASNSGGSTVHAFFQMRKQPMSFAKYCDIKTYRKNHK